jgi:nucleotide-binding universal stress UspA family protein
MHHPTIVCGVDRSHHARAAARLARGLADRLGLGLELIHVVDAGPSPGSEGGTAAVRVVTEEHLDLRGVGVGVETGVTSDVLAAASRRAALLVIGTRGEGAMRSALLGSVSSKLTHDPPSAVVVVPPGVSDADPPLAGRSIVCGVRDGRDSAPAHVAARLASDLGLSLTLAHVLAPPTVPMSTSDEAQPASMLRPAAHEFEAAMATLGAIGRSIATDIPVDIELEVLDGPPGPQLDRLAAATDAAMIAVGACDQSPLTGALAGAPTLHLMRYSARPVLVCPRPQRLTRTRRRTAGQFSSVAS